MDSDRRGPRFVRVNRPEIDRESIKDKEPRQAGQPPGHAAAQHRDTGDRTRIVVPRQERGRRPTGLDLELREIRWGTTTRGAYLRVVPSRQQFHKVETGHIEATEFGSKPRGAIERTVQAVKGIVLGSPLAISQAIHERLSKIKALAILGSDPLSSSAYATEEALLILALAGAAGLSYLLPIGIVVAVLLALVAVSYQQTIRAYPNGGGAYAVSHDNLGQTPGLVAAAALAVDYTLLVSVSTAAGVAAITSAVPDLLDYRVPISLAVIAFFTLGNLRGIRESGTLFAAPTYFFIAMMAGTIVYGFIQVLLGDAPGTLTSAAPPQHPERLEELALGGVSLWLVLRAFSAGASALTGVEAMANGVPTFKPPEATNARKTMAWMAAIAIFLFLGITFLSSRYGLVPQEGETLVSDMGRTILGDNALYYAFQLATALILFLAANTSFNAFPLLGAILARDRYMPRQFNFRGDRLSYSNGILLLALIAAILLVVYEAEVTRLIPLYAVGVFVAFTLSQSGMVRKWLRERGPGWHSGIVMNAVGAIVTGVVAVIITATKFTEGAWISILMMIVLVVVYTLIKRHYDWYERSIRLAPEPQTMRGPTSVELGPTGTSRGHVVIPVDELSKITMGAIAMAREISGQITAVHLSDKREDAERFRGDWEAHVPDVPLQIIESPYRAFAAPMVAYIELLLQTEPDRKITVILPGFKAHHWWESLLHNQAIRRLRPFLEHYDEVRVLDFDFDVRSAGESTPPAAPASASA